MAVEFSTQRISDRTLDSIEREIGRIFERLGVKRRPINIRFGGNGFNARGNYYELGAKSLALVYIGLIAPLQIPDPERPGLRLRDDMDTDYQEAWAKVYNSLRGFSALSMVGRKSFPAIFLNAAQGGTGEDCGEACHTLIHEVIHMHSWNGSGFQASGYFRGWTEFEPLLEAEEGVVEVDERDIYFVLDEGMTEFFARIVRHNLLGDGSIEAAQRPALPINDGIPVYDYPLRVVCSLAETYGLETLAKAYFDGDQGLRKALAKRIASGKLGGEYLRAIAKTKLDEGPRELPDELPLTGQGDGVRKLKRMASVHQIDARAAHLAQFDSRHSRMPALLELMSAVRYGSYNDPAWAFWEAHGYDLPKPDPKLVLLACMSIAAAVYIACQRINS